MMTALELRPLRVALVSYRSIGEATSSAWAQGGIAAAVGDDDTPALHAADTIAAGAGLVERRVADRLAADGPHAIERVAALGVRFDRDGAAYALGREAAHSRRRGLRAGGDATGAELIRAVEVVVRESPDIVAIEGARALDVALADGRICGLVVRHDDGRIETLAAAAVVLATGGIGGLYRYTTNPTSSRGSGIAIAARAGARLADLEFVQFHPTAFDVASDPLPLVTEALRGEGATLLDGAGARIMAGVDPALELAPRDVVARRVFAIHRSGGRVYLDAREALGAEFPVRFPTVFASCRRYGIDPRIAPIPVVAAAHYHMGGVAVDLAGRSNVPGLYACGEVAATGVHGANRLASNSLLEAVIYPERIALDIRARNRKTTDGDDEPIAVAEHPPLASASAAEWQTLRETMYAGVGVERDAPALARAIEVLASLRRESPSEEVRDAALVGSFVARAALRRRETRGSHVRTDYPSDGPSDGAHSYATLAELSLASGPA
ncbi:MAG: L-aspartate oxidase [Vulcanimicrobiaceae bacterium]